MTRKSSFGNCRLCGTRKGKVAMVAHLQKCLSANAKNRPVAAVMLIRAQQGTGMVYWIDVAMPMNSNLDQLDGLLRQVWLECCDHLSGFFKGRYDEVSSSLRLVGAFRTVGDVLGYQYDFGSTTELTLRFNGIAQADSTRPVVVARNEPPVWLCDICGEPSANVCSQCSWTGGGFCCDNHREDHECGEEMLLPVVNSPRMGVCRYTGEGGDVG